MEPLPAALPLADPASADIPPPEFLRLATRSADDEPEALPAPGGQSAPAPAAPPGGGEGRGPAVLTVIETDEKSETPANIPLVLEALLLAADEPPSISQLAHATNVAPDAVEEALDALERASAHRGVRLQRGGSRVRLVTAPEAAPFVERLLGVERPNRLSKAALETLAIIAYRQPVTRAGIEAVRGVACDGTLGTLRQRDLIRHAGQVEAPGRPHLWATTGRFLEHFGLSRVTELPPLPEAPAGEQGVLALEQALRRDSAQLEAPPAAVPPEAVPSEAVPSEAVPPEAVPSAAVPSAAVPSEAVPSERMAAAAAGD